MLEQYHQLLLALERWWMSEPGLLGLGFDAHQLLENRRGRLLPEQAPPYLGKLVLATLLFALLWWLARFTLRQRGQRARFIVALCGTALCALPAGYAAALLTDVVHDRIEARTCVYTGVSSGLHPRDFMGMYLSVGLRLFHAYHVHPSAYTSVQSGLPYRVYYACHSEALASAELALATPESTPEAYQRELQQLLRFDADALARNQAGELSFGQWPFGPVLWSGGFGLLMLICAGTVVVIATSERSWGRKLAQYFAGLLMLPIGLFVMCSAGPSVRDLFERRVCQSSGGIDLTQLRGKGRTSGWELSIDGSTITFPYAPSGMGLLRSARPHRAFYLCNARTLLSLEAL